jgi:hypothetical protein
MSPFVFIVGCPRSGTTLLRRVVNAHPQVAIPHETHWVPDFFQKRVGLTPDGLVTPELIDRLVAHRKFPKLGVSRQQLEGLLGAGAAVPYARFVTGVYDLHGQGQGKALVGDKTPEYGRKIRTLHGLWPEAKFVHLIRDGRDVCLSHLNWQVKAAKLSRRLRTWDEDPVSTAAVWWEWNVRLVREAGGALGPGLYHELRYEALVARPEEECGKLCAFLGLPYDAAMLRFHEGRTRADPTLDAKRAWRPITPGLRDWRTEMPAEGQERFEASAGDLLGELGYPRAVSRPRPCVLDRAARVRESFIEDVRAGEAVLPERW